jgi:hypothetical protein
MRAALLRAAAGKPTALPLRVQYHVVAAHYGTTPDRVREWPADDFTDAMAFLRVTGS